MTNKQLYSIIVALVMLVLGWFYADHKEFREKLDLHWGKLSNLSGRLADKE